MNDRSRTAAALAALLLGAGVACATPPELTPAPTAVATPGPGVGAAEYETGVRIEVRAQAWDGAPDALRTEVTPMLVQVTNGSPVPIRIQYDEMMLLGGDGRTFAAIPPFNLDGAVTQQVTTYAAPPVGFSVAPYLSGYYPGLTPIADPLGFGYDPLYYDNYYNVLVQRQLPTADMIQRALPEGVLQPGGSVSGFVYFEYIGDATERAMFRANVVNARTGAQFGTATIPFVVTGGN